MWETGHHCRVTKKKTELEKLYDIKGDLDAESAKDWFYRFLGCNPAFAISLLIGVELYPIQDLLLRSYWLRDFNLTVAGRGFSKSFSVCAFIVFYAIFNPGSKIGICSGSFRQAKMIFKQIEDWFNKPEGRLLKAEVTDPPHHESDSWHMKIAGSSITAIPLTEKIRGQRFNLMVVDELFLVPDEIMDSVIIPFLSVEKDSQHRQRIRDLENTLIKEGKMRPEDRTVFPSNKMIGLSSATFKADSLYKSYYEPYLKLIHNPEATGVSHCVWKLSYEAAPPGLMDPKNVEEARRKSSTARFNMEYRAIFGDDSQGYFSWTKIEQASLGTNEYPKNLLTAQAGKVYILGMDPNNSEKETSDNFAMCLLELDVATNVAVVVHCYAVAKSDIGHRVKYLKYLLEYFNVAYICVDAMGGPQFIRVANTLWTEKDAGALTLQEIPSDFRTPEGIVEARNEYNMARGKIVHVQAAQQSSWKLDANDVMLFDIENKKLRFAAPIQHENDYDFAMRENIPIEDIHFSDEIYESDQMEVKKSEFILRLNEMTELTKKELRLIDIASATGVNVDFNIPKNLRGSSSPDRDRRGSYTALLLANWGRKCYMEIINGAKESEEIWTPAWVA